MPPVILLILFKSILQNISKTLQNIKVVNSWVFIAVYSKSKTEKQLPCDALLTYICPRHPKCPRKSDL